MRVRPGTFLVSVCLCLHLCCVGCACSSGGVVCWMEAGSINKPFDACLACLARRRGPCGRLISVVSCLNLHASHGVGVMLEQASLPIFLFLFFYYYSAFLLIFSCFFLQVLFILLDFGHPSFCAIPVSFNVREGSERRERERDIEPKKEGCGRWSWLDTRKCTVYSC